MVNKNDPQEQSNPGALKNGDAAKLPFQKRSDSTWRFAVKGATWSVLSAFPIAGMIACMFRFPVPFAGYQSGFNAILPAIIATAVYGVMLGGFLPLAILGAVGACLAGKLTKLPVQRWMTVIVPLIVTSSCLLVLAVLDWLIGPW